MLAQHPECTGSGNARARHRVGRPETKRGFSHGLFSLLANFRGLNVPFEIRNWLEVNYLKAGTGIEPVNSGFADRGLTTWLPRRIRLPDFIRWLSTVSIPSLVANF